MERSLTDKKPVYATCFLFLVMISTVSYFITSLIDPGYVSKRSNVNVEEGGLLSEDKVNMSCAGQNINSN